MNKKIKVVVASKNPVKKQAVLDGFLSYFDEVEVEGVNCESGVSDQPMSDKETKSGATNRVENIKRNFPEADYWVGIEGGIEKMGKGLTAFAWVVVESSENYGEARTTSFLLPAKVAQLIEQGYELGAANDIIFDEKNSKQKNGAVGLLTKNKISRTELYLQAVQLALIPFVNPELF